MKRNRSISKKIIARFTDAHRHWSVNEPATILTGTFTTSDYISGLLFVGKIIVMANVYGAEPICTIHHQKVQIKISATSKSVLDENHLTFAEKISTIFLSTKKRYS